MQTGAGGEVAGPSLIKPMMITTRHPAVRALLRDRPRRIEANRRQLHHQVHPYRPFSEVMVDGAWTGQRCFIVGGGPSLEGFDFERLRGQGKIIAVNRAYEFVPFADICFFMDGSNNTFYGLVKRGKLGAAALQAWTDFKGHKVFLNIMGRQYNDVYSVRSMGAICISPSLSKGLCHGSNSGFGALNLALCLKANPIYLLGFDGKYRSGKSHFHSGYGRQMGEKTFKSFVRGFERLAQLLRRTSFRVINLNPDSGIKCFPFSTIDEILGNHKI
jgi:hypothetical protein